MNREVLKNCRLFSSMTYGEISSLLGCLGARYKRMLSGVSMYSDRIIVVLSGELTAGGKRYTNGEVILSENVPRNVSTLEQSEALFIKYPRILNACKNCCSAHKKAVANLMRLTLGYAREKNQRLPIAK